MDGGPDRASYLLSRMSIRRTDAPGMRQWRKRLFIALANNAVGAADYFRLPVDRTVMMGSHVEL